MNTFQALTCIKSTDVPLIKKINNFLKNKNKGNLNSCKNNSYFVLIFIVSTFFLLQFFIGLHPLQKEDKVPLHNIQGCLPVLLTINLSRRDQTLDHFHINHNWRKKCDIRNTLFKEITFRLKVLSLIKLATLSTLSEFRMSFSCIH